MPASIERFTVTITITNVTPDLVYLVAEKLPNLTYLSFVLYPETDVAHIGVEIADAWQSASLIFALPPSSSGYPFLFPLRNSPNIP